MLTAAGVAGPALLITVMAGWATLAIYHSNVAGEPLRAALAAALATGTLLAPTPWVGGLMVVAGTCNTLCLLLLARRLIGGR